MPLPQHSAAGDELRTDNRAPLSRAGFARFVRGVALCLVAGLVTLTAQAAAPKVIRIAAPDLSAGATPSYGGQVDYLNANKLLEKEFAKDGIKIQWSFFKGAGPAINEAFANRQLDFAFVYSLLDRYFLDNFQRSVELARQFGLIRRTFDVKTWADDRYLNAGAPAARLAEHLEALRPIRGHFGTTFFFESKVTTS